MQTTAMICVASIPLFSIQATILFNRFATRRTVDTIDRPVDDTRVTSSSRSFSSGSRILPRKRRHFRSPGPRDRRISVFRDGRTHLDRARSGTLLALLSARQRRDDVPRRVARSAIDTEEFLVEGRELEVRLRPFELR